MPSTRWPGPSLLREPVPWVHWPSSVMNVPGDPRFGGITSQGWTDRQTGPSCLESRRALSPHHQAVCSPASSPPPLLRSPSVPRSREKDHGARRKPAGAVGFPEAPGRAPTWFLDPSSGRPSGQTADTMEEVGCLPPATSLRPQSGTGAQPVLPTADSFDQRLVWGV